MIKYSVVELTDDEELTWDGEYKRIIVAEYPQNSLEEAEGFRSLLYGSAGCESYIKVEDTETGENYFLDSSHEYGAKLQRTDPIDAVKKMEITEEDVTKEIPTGDYSDKTVLEVYNELGKALFANYIRAISKTAIYALDPSFSKLNQDVKVNYLCFPTIFIHFVLDRPEIEYEENFCISINCDRSDSYLLSLSYSFGKMGSDVYCKENIRGDTINVDQVLTETITSTFLKTKASRDKLMLRLNIIANPVDPADFDKHSLREIYYRQKDFHVFTGQIKNACDGIMSKIEPINATGLAKSQPTLLLDEPYNYSIVYRDTTASNRSDGESVFRKELKIIGSVEPPYIHVTYKEWEGVLCSGNLTDPKLTVTSKSVVNHKKKDFLKELKNSILSAYQQTDM